MFAAISLGCFSDPNDAEPRELPDVSGNWTVALAGVPAGAAPGNGQCTLDPFRVELRGPVRNVDVDLYQGSRASVRIVCSGITASVTQTTGLRDTVVVSPTDTVAAQVWGRTCNDLGQCTDPRGAFFLSLGTIALGGFPNPTQMSGNFVWSNASGTAPLVTGSWTAVR